MAIDTLNACGLPDKYSIINGDEGLLGIGYTGKKGMDVVLLPKYTSCTVFKALGRVFMAYMENTEEDETPYYVIRNRKGDLETDMPVYDFVACNKALYGRIETNRGIELAQFNKELEVVKTFGFLTFADYYTNNGNRVIPNTRQTLDVRDQNNRLCRINMTDNTLEDVISFGSDAGSRVNKEPVEVVVEYWDYVVNITRGTICKTADTGGTSLEVARLTGLENNRKTLTNLFGTEGTPEEVEVPVKRHYETHELIKYDEVTPERAGSIDKILKSLNTGETLESVQKLFEYFAGTSNNLVETVAKFLVDEYACVYESSDTTVMNNKYLMKVLIENNKMYILVRSRSGKVTLTIKDRPEDLNEGTYNKLVGNSVVYEKEVSYDVGRSIPRPQALKNKNNAHYKRALNIKCTLENENGNTLDLDFMLFDRFTYGPLAHQSEESLSENTDADQKNKNRHNYNDKNIILSTETSDVNLVF